jgi:hypothetical protein
MQTTAELLTTLLHTEGFAGALSMLADAALEGADPAKAREYAKLIIAINAAQRLAAKLES